MKTWFKKKKKQIKEWCIDLVAWLKTYRTLPTITIEAEEIVVRDHPAFTLKGRMHANIQVTGNLIIQDPDRRLIHKDNHSQLICTVSTREFFDQLGKWYCGDPGRSPHLVKFYCQVDRFNFEIYQENRAFFGNPEFRSEVYEYWHTPEEMYNILRAIERQLFILKTNN